MRRTKVALLLVAVLCISAPVASACDYWDCTGSEGTAHCWQYLSGVTPNYAMSCRVVCDGTPGEGGACACEYGQRCFIG